MTPERWQQLKELFESAVDLQADDRQEFLDRACGDEPELRRQVESLILSSTDDSSFLEAVLGDAAGSLWDPFIEPVEGRRIGLYRLTRLLARGGMGEVYLAMRADDQYEKQVAIKLIRAGLCSRDIILRFRSERQILANLDHPNIARLLDGGTIEGGFPYVVMEYVDGEPIDDYCDHHELTTFERLKLFLEVCAAVQYAHRNLIVHRDIKPGNILVTSEGVPKLLDFGIAKLLDSDLAPHTAAETRTAMRPLTPEYASPEHVRGDAITTAADVYSLGVVLYELLTDRRPYKLKTRQPVEIERVICEQEPEPPSLAVLRQPGPETSLSRPQRSPDRLRRELSGDLDNIVLMALRKEPAARYQAVDQLAEDIRRHLEGLPVKARPATLAYRAQKFIRRHRAWVAAAAAFLLFMVAFSLTTLAQANRLERERDVAARERRKAESVAGFLVSLFQVSDPGEARGNTVTAREILDRGAREITTELQDQPEVQATLMETIGRVYNSLGLYRSSIPLLEQALKTRRRTLGEQHPDTAKSLHDLATALFAKGDYDLAEPLFRQVIEMRKRILGEDHMDVAQSLNKLAGVLRVKGEYRESENLFRQALALRRKGLGEEHRDVAETLNRLAQTVQDRGDYEAAEPLFRQSLAIRQKLLREHPDVADTMNNLALLLQRRGEYAEAEPLFRESLSMHVKLEGEEHPEVSNSRSNLASILRILGHYEEAELLARQSVASRRNLFGDDDDRTARSMTVLAHVLYARGDYGGSETILQRCRATFRVKMGAGHPWVGRSTNLLARVLNEKGECKRAEPLALEALALRRYALGEEHPEVAESLATVASIQMCTAQPDTAESNCRRALEILKKKLRTGHPENAAPLLLLGTILTRKGDPARAESYIREAVQIRRKSLPEGHPETAEAESDLGACLTALLRFEEAEPILLSSHATLMAKRRGKTAREAQARLIRLYQSRTTRQ